MNQSDPKSESRSVTSARKAMLFSTLTLFSGIAIGAGLMLIVIGSSEKQKPLPNVRMVERITRELDLSPEQKEHIASVVQKHMKVMESIREEAHPKIMAELEQMNDGIMAVLDEEQQLIWQDKVKRMQDHLSRMRQRRGLRDRRRRDRDPNSPPQRGQRRPGERFNDRPGDAPPPPQTPPPGNIN
ncbi:MAG: hypothetical protein ACYSOF_09955 [Planctomycetota bacterium]|jgi:hypothetical protein